MTRIAIVGSGPSAIYALQALLDCRHPLEITMFEAGETAGVGTPYDPRLNSVEMLANIASLEIPPVGMTLVDYLDRCDDAALAEIGVERDAVGEREFYPRIALGAYYRDRLAALVADAGTRNHVVTVRTRHRVVDVAPTENGVDIRYRSGTGGLRRLCVDKAILATGHVVPTSKASGLIRDARGIDATVRDIGIFGSSLSAIDVAVAVATERGQFIDGRYERDDDAAPFTLTMMSRGGRLPEADFFCPLPAEPAPGFTEDDVATVAGAATPGTVLDRVFEQFAMVLAEADPAYAARIGLSALTADTFPAAYFAERDAQDPFVWARQNLDEVTVNRAQREVVAWRYAILRCHEAFASCLDALSPDELARFNAGLKRVFADNYAAVPPLSIERLLALHEAGVLRVEKLSDDYEVQIDEDSGRSRVCSAATIFDFDRIVDARGQALAGEDEFPFPTLRMILKANRDLDDARDGGAVTVDADYRLTEGANPLGNVWCLSLPFLLDRKPFIQGLTSAADMGRAAACAIIADLDAPRREQDNCIDDLIASIGLTQPIMLPDRAVMLVPKSAMV